MFKGYDAGYKGMLPPYIVLTQSQGRFSEAGFLGLSADPEYGGLGLPTTVTSAVNEMIASSCLALQLAPIMSQGQINALSHHASDALKAIYLPKLLSGTGVTSEMFDHFVGGGKEGAE